MFLCEKCHKDSGCKVTWHPRSKGPCEDCGKVKICYDCHK